MALAPPREGRRKSKRRQWWPGGLFITEIEAPTQYRIGPRGGKYPLPARRADAIWVPHNKGQIHGYEVKVSRADLRHELEDPDKCVAWKQYCNTWTLVVPGPGLIEGFDIPDDWGVVGPPSGRRVRAMTAYRPSVALEPIDQTPALFRLATTSAFRANRLQQQIEKLEGDVEYLNDIVKGLDLGFELDAA